MNTIVLEPDGRGSFTFTFSSSRGTEGPSDRRSTADKEQTAKNQIWRWQENSPKSATTNRPEGQQKRLRPVLSRWRRLVPLQARSWGSTVNIPGESRRTASGKSMSLPAGRPETTIHRCRTRFRNYR